MEERNCEILFEYLRSILFESDVKTLDLSTLDEPFVKLGRGMMVLQTMVEEMQTYSAELSKGNLSAKLPDKNNLLCTNMKNMHATLNHLTWQAKQVAEGDYSQHVSYLGEFSKAFNTMTKQLKDREERLADRAYYDPVTAIRNRIFFEEYMEEMMCKKRKITLGYMDLDGLKYVNDNYGHVEGDEYIMFFADLIGKHFSNDGVFARIGGDEFCLVIEGEKREYIAEKLENIRNTLLTKNIKDYPMSFSYGVHEIDLSNSDLTLDAIMHEADVKMYNYKRENKMNR